MLFEEKKNKHDCRLVIFNPSVLNNRIRVYQCPLDRLKRRKCKKISYNKTGCQQRLQFIPKSNDLG